MSKIPTWVGKLSRTMNLSVTGHFSKRKRICYQMSALWFRGTKETFEIEIYVELWRTRYLVNALFTQPRPVPLPLANKKNDYVVFVEQTFPLESWLKFKKICLVCGQNWGLCGLRFNINFFIIAQAAGFWKFAFTAYSAVGLLPWPVISPCQGSCTTCLFTVTSKIKKRYWSGHLLDKWNYYLPFKYNTFNLHTSKT